MLKNKFIFMLLLMSVGSLKVYASELDIVPLKEYFINYKDEVIELKKFIDKSSGDALFSIGLYSDEINTNIVSNVFNYEIFSDIDNSILDDIQDILYLGYGYNNHNSDEWYILSQYMLWQTLGYDLKILDVNGNNILELFKESYVLYQKLIENYKKYPSFMDDDIDINFGETKSLIDSHNIIDEYILEIPHPLRYTYIESGINLSGSIPIQQKISCYRIDRGERSNRVYDNGKYRFITNKASSNRVYETMVNLHGTKIKLINIDENNNPIKDNYFYLYDSNNKKITTLRTYNNGEGITVYLPYDNYYLLENTINDNYVSINNKIYFDINDYGITEVILKYKEKTANLIINMNYQNSEGLNVITDFKDIFQIYKNGDLIAEKSANSNGQVIFDLPKGEYFLKQVVGVYDYPLVEQNVTITSYEDILINKDIIVKESVLEEDIKDDNENNELNNEAKENISLKEEIENVKSDISANETEFVVPNTNFNLTKYIIIIFIGLIFLGIKLYVH